MPGIFGYIRKNQKNSNDSLFEQMGRTLSHQSWYSSASWKMDNCAMGALSTSPFFTRADNLAESQHSAVLVEGNGLSIDNRFFNTPQNQLARTILNLYEKNGTDFIHKVKGSFRIVIYDKASGNLHLINDRFGFNHIYYFYDTNCFIFSPEIKALLRYPAFNKTINKKAISFYLSGEGVWGNETFFQHVRLVPPGSILTFKEIQPHIHQYFRPEYKVDLSLTAEEIIERGYTTQLNALIKRLPKDPRTKIILPLSGGLDSRYLLSLLLETGYSNIRLYTHGHEACKDYQIARQVAKIAGIPDRHQRIQINPDWMMTKALESVWLNEGHVYCKNFHLLGIVEEIGPQLTPFVNGIFGAYLSLDDGSFYKPEDIIENNDLNFIEKDIEAMCHFPSNHAVLRSICKAGSFEEMKSQSREYLWNIFESLNHIDKYCDKKVMLIHYNLGRRFQTIIDLNQYYFYDILPFVDDDLFELYLTIPNSLRINHKVYHELLKNKFPEMAKIKWAKNNLNLFSSPRKKKFYSTIDSYKSRLRGKINRTQFLPLHIKNHGPYKYEGEWTKSNPEIFDFYFQWVKKLEHFPLELFDMDAVVRYLKQARSGYILQWPHMNMIMKLASLAMWHHLFVEESIPPFNSKE